MSRTPWLLAPILPLVLLGACNTDDADRLKRDSGQLMDSAGDSLKNASAAIKVNTVLSLRKGVDMSRFSVQSKEGTITLEGTVRSAAEKKLVVDTAYGVRGVDKVVDKLKVDAPK